MKGDERIRTAVCEPSTDSVYDKCEIDTCGENRDGTPWPAEHLVRDIHGKEFWVCSCHRDGWYE